MENIAKLRTADQNAVEQTRTAINWFEAASRSIAAQVPEVKEAASRVTRRLAALVLERLPEETCREILEMLPESASREIEGFECSARSGPDHSIGYPAFVERTGFAIGRDVSDELARRVADVFLWSFANDFPSDLKSKLLGALPADLRNRMDLRTAQSETARVA